MPASSPRLCAESRVPSLTAGHGMGKREVAGRARLVIWQEELQCMPGVHIFAWNDRGVPLRITNVAVFACENIPGGCIERDPENILEPGDRARLYTIMPLRPGWPDRFQWQASTASVQRAR